MADAVAIIIYEKDKILLQKRDSYAQKNPDLWGFFGGSLRDNENPLHGIKREIFEELAYQAKNPDLFFEMNLEGDGKKFFFIESYDTEQPLLLREGKAMQWFIAKELKDIEIVPHHKTVLLYFLNKKNSRERHESN